MPSPLSTHPTRSREHPPTNGEALLDTDGTGARGGFVFGVAMLGLSSLVALIAVILFSLRSRRGMAFDHRLMESVGASATAAMKISDRLTYVSVGGVALCLVVCVGVALARRQLLLAVAAAVLIIGANVSTRVLKHGLLERVDGRSNSLPSGHTTVAVSLGLAAVLVAPALWRWVIVPLAGFVGTFVGAGTVVGQWHRPGDVLAAIAVCGIWAAIALAIAGHRERTTRPEQGWAWRSGSALIGSAVVGLCFVGWGLRPQDHDVNLVLAVLALAPIGVLVGALTAWVSTLAERHLA